MNEKVADFIEHKQKNSVRGEANESRSPPLEQEAGALLSERLDENGPKFTAIVLQHRVSEQVRPERRTLTHAITLDLRTSAGEQTAMEELNI